VKDGDSMGEGNDDDLEDALDVDDDDADSPEMFDLAAVLGGEGGLDLSNLFDQAMALQSDLAAKQQALTEQVVEGQAGGGAVTIRVTGGYVFEEVRIRPDAVDPDDVEMLQDLVLAALHDASRAVNDLQAQTMGGLDLGGLLGDG
jgi:DNA-binding YbaB/EbfC family protein